MKLAKILSVLTSEPLLCTGEYRAVLYELFQQHATLSREEFAHTRTGRAKSGSDLCVEQMTIENGIAIIPIGGPIGIDLGEFEKGAGAVDMDDICRELTDADENDEVEAAILNFDTPGGMVTGLPETGNRIKAFEKPIYAFTRGTLASAGYWLAACTDGIFATPSSNVGSIGVCASFMDLSKMADNLGVKVKVFGSGKFKGMGAPGTSLTAEQEIHMQQRVMDLAQMFYDHVRDCRGTIADADMQGQMFRGKAAVDRGFVDGLMENIGELKAFLS